MKERNKPELRAYNTIAVIQTAFLGDVALALPLAQAIKNEHHSCRLLFVTTPQAEELVKLSDAVDKVIVYDKRRIHNGLAGIRQISEILKENKTELIISPHRSLRTTLLSRFAKPKVSIGFDVNSLSFLYDFRVKYRTDRHEIDRDLSLLSVIKSLDSNIVPEVKLNFGKNDTDFVSNLFNIKLKDKKKGIILLAPGSVWETKRWREEYFIELTKLLNNYGYKCCIIGSRDDASLCERIASNSNAVSLAGTTTIPQTILLMKQSKLTITNDSSPIHFAYLAGCPTLAIFGPTSPIFGFAPRGKFDRIIENEALKCRPCAIHGGRKCPLGTHECMKSIFPKDLCELSIKIIESKDVFI